MPKADKKKYSLKSSGSGTLSEIKDALKELLKSLDDAQFNKGKLTFEDDVLCTEIIEDEAF